SPAASPLRAVAFRNSANRYGLQTGEKPARQVGQGAVNAYPSDILTRSGLKGRSRSLLPVACAKALAMAATIGLCDAAPDTSGLSFGRSINSTSIFGTSGMVRIG